MRHEWSDESLFSLPGVEELPKYVQREIRSRE